MSAFYLMRFAGQLDRGEGAIYVGKGIVLGVDVGGLRYKGAYSDQGGRMKGSVTLTAPAGGGQLVTGQTMKPGQTVTLTIDWPSNFAGGQQQVSVNGRPVNVTFEKLGDIP